MDKDPDAFHLIFEDGDPLRAEVVRSALEAGGIDCFIQNDGVQNLFSMGGIGGLNPLMGTVKVYIRAEDRVLAETLLADLQSMPAEEEERLERSEGPSLGPLPETPKPQGKGFLFSLRQWFLK